MLHRERPVVAEPAADALGERRRLTLDLCRMYLDRLPCRDAEVEPGPGTWFIESPFFPTVDSTGGKVVLPQITWGTHRLFSTAGPSWTLEIGERESVLMPGVPR